MNIYGVCRLILYRCFRRMEERSACVTLCLSASLTSSSSARGSCRSLVSVSTNCHRVTKMRVGQCGLRQPKQFVAAHAWCTCVV